MGFVWKMDSGKSSTVSTSRRGEDPRGSKIAIVFVHTEHNPAGVFCFSGRFRVVDVLEVLDLGRSRAHRRCAPMVLVLLFKSSRQRVSPFLLSSLLLYED